MKVAAVIVALLVALALQSTLAGLRIGGTTAVNLVLVVVVYGALSFGATGGLVIGTMSAGLAPVKGITLPLMSYGGSSLIAALASFGLIINVRMRRFTN